MQIIPVIDIMRGVVVRGVAGQRDEYRPIVSRLTNDPSPAAVAHAFRQLGFDTAYVADLDAITGQSMQTLELRAIAAADLQMWVDAGDVELDDWFTAPHCVVVGSETLASPRLLSDQLRRFGPERTIFSLDLKQQVPLVKCAEWQALSPLAIVEQVLALGVQRIIVLDLARVGVRQGVGTETICRAIRQLSLRVEIIAGGGVRHQSDLNCLADAGCNAALVASALHDGSITNQRE